MIQAFAAIHPEMAVTILRPCTVFGPAVDNYVSRMFLRPFSASVRGNDPLVQFVHENDFVRACRKAVEKKIPGAFNIVGKGALRVTEAAALAGTRLLPLPAFLLYPLVEVLWRLRFPGIEVNSGYLDYVRYPFVACAKKAASELGFAAAFSSRQVLAENVAPLAKGRRE